MSLYEPLTVIETGVVVQLDDEVVDHDATAGGESPKAQDSRVTPCPHDVAVVVAVTGTHESYVDDELDEDDVA